MNPIKDVYRLVTTPLKALFVVGLCGVINYMTFTGTWWVKWVALGMGIATLVALAKGLRTLLLLGLVWWVGRIVHRRYGPAMRERFDAWVATTHPGWAQWRDVVAAAQGPQQTQAPMRH